MTIETPADGRDTILDRLSPFELVEIGAFVDAHGLSAFAAEGITFDGWLTLWPPQAQCYDGQAGWLTGEVKVSGLGWHEPVELDEADLGEFDTLAEALGVLAERRASFEQFVMAPSGYAIADTHPKDGDVQQAPLVSGGGAGTAIAHNVPPSPSIGSIDMTLISGANPALIPSEPSHSAVSRPVGFDPGERKEAE